MESNNVTTLEPEDEGIGPLIQRVRLGLGWSQDTLAERVGMSRAYLSQIEASKTKWPAKYIAALSRELGVPPSILGRAAGRIIRDSDFATAPLNLTGKGKITLGGSMELVTADPESDPWLRVVFAEAPNLSPTGRRSLANHLRTLKELEASYKAEAERDAKPDRGEG